MPIYEYKTDDGETIEMIYSVKERPDEIVSTLGRVAKLAISLCARTASKWGDSSEKPYFDRGLGMRVEGEKHAERIARSRGLVNLREVGSDGDQDRMMESYLSKLKDESDAVNSDMRAFADAKQKHNGDTMSAVEEVWSAKRILSE